MTASELAAIMLQWEELLRKADKLRAEIEAAVLEIGKTQTVGNVRATFSAGRKSYDYKAACETNGYSDDDLAQWQKVHVTYDYKGACEENGLEAPFSQSDPSVTVKLLA